MDQGGKTKLVSKGSDSENTPQTQVPGIEHTFELNTGLEKDEKKDPQPDLFGKGRGAKRFLEDIFTGGDRSIATKVKKVFELGKRLQLNPTWLDYFTFSLPKVRNNGRKLTYKKVNIFHSNSPTLTYF